MWRRTSVMAHWAEALCVAVTYLVSIGLSWSVRNNSHSRKSSFGSCYHSHWKRDIEVVMIDDQPDKRIYDFHALWRQNKAGYTAELVACNWAAWKILKNQIRHQPTDRPSNQPTCNQRTDAVYYRFASTWQKFLRTLEKNLSKTRRT